MKTKLTEIDIKKSYSYLLEYFARYDFDFFVFTICATTICFVGFAMDSPAIIIGSMVLSPLLYPAIAIAISLFQGDWKNFIKSLSLLLVGFIVVIALSFILAMFFEIDSRGTELIERIEADITLYFIVAFVSGFAGMFCFLWPKALEAIIGIAIAIALLPPLVILGISISNNQIFFQRSLEIVLINSAGILLGAMLALFLVKIGKRLIQS
jgi:uncharacterized hydrophobic protein (TIGR00271 family)